MWFEVCGLGINHISFVAALCASDFLRRLASFSTASASTWSVLSRLPLGRKGFFFVGFSFAAALLALVFRARVRMF
jgi:hypothetical protein